MELNDNGKGISGIAHKADYSGLHDEKAERFAKAFLEFLKSLIDDAGITEEEWKEAFIPWKGQDKQPRLSGRGNINNK